jgi:hypothetical protein
MFTLLIVVVLVVIAVGLFSNRKLFKEYVRLERQRLKGILLTGKPHFLLADEDHTLLDSKEIQVFISQRCPICDGFMVKRKGVSGKNMGKVFLLCGKYPECRGIIYLDDTFKL